MASGAINLTLQKSSWEHLQKVRHITMSEMASADKWSSRVWRVLSPQSEVDHSINKKLQVWRPHLLRTWFNHGRSVVADGTYGLDEVSVQSARETVLRSLFNQVVFSQLERMLSGVSGSVFPSLSTSQINDFKVLQPTIELIHCFAALTSPLSNVQQSNVRENLQLSSIRDNLLSRLLLREVKQTNGAASLEARVL